MLSFSYTIDLPLRDTLNRIDLTRSQILAFPLPIRSENKLIWEGIAIRTWATLALAGHDVPKHYVATILSHPTHPTRAVAMIYAIRDCYQYIHDSWRANPKSISIATMEQLFTTLFPNRREVFAAHEGALRELLDYLSTESEHPVIAAALAHIHVLTEFAGENDSIFARMVHYLFLAKYGYDVRGYATPDRSWESDPVTYRHLGSADTAAHNLPLWLAYIAQSTLTDSTRISEDIRNAHFHIEFPPAFWELSDRQKEILKLLEMPESSITNKKVTKRFHVSTITASRDLAKLTTLGLLYPHGKGRSVYYTKI